MAVKIEVAVASLQVANAEVAACMIHVVRSKADPRS